MSENNGWSSIFNIILSPEPVSHLKLKNELGSYDLMLCNHVPDADPALEKMSRVLKFGSKAITVTSDASSFLFGHLLFNKHFRVDVLWKLNRVFSL